MQKPATHIQRSANSNGNHLSLVVAVSLASALLWWIVKGDTINSDEAVIGLMSLKISKGLDFPFFFWQADYCGPIASYLAAPLHWFFQPSGRLLHAILIPMHATFVIGVYLVACEWLGEESALIAALFAAMPILLFPYSPLGGYTESFVILPWIVYLFFGRQDASRKSLFGRYFGGGLLNGFALWVFPLLVPMTFVSFVFLYRDSDKKNFKAALSGFALSLVPMIVFNIEHPAATFFRLLSRPVQMDRRDAMESLHLHGAWHTGTAVVRQWIESSLQSFKSVPRVIFSLVGLTNAESVWIPVAGAIGLLAMGFLLWSCWGRGGNGKVMPKVLAWMAIANVAYVVVVGMQRDRYLIPLLFLIPFGLALIHERFLAPLKKYQQYGVVAVVLVLSILSNYTNLGSYRNDYFGLASYLETNGLTRGYADYFIAYPLVYLSNERLIFSPAFNTPDADRYKPYTELVSESERGSSVDCG